jgi:AcrR family transcriptional regulator
MSTSVDLCRMSTKPRTGRRPGPSSTRDEILRAARRRFADDGYDRATFRRIAADAGVDPALVVQFFGSKQDLFAAATVPPVTLAELSAAPTANSSASPGLRLARLLMLWLEDDGARQALLARIRSASSEPAAAAIVRKMIGGQLIEFARAMDGDRPDVRASLLATQFLGVVFARFVVAVEPLASMSGDEIADWLGPTFDLYLTGPIDDSALGRPAVA